MKIKNIALVFLVLMILPLISASITVEKEFVTDTIITDLNNPAILHLKITNFGEQDVFRVYSLIGMTITPEENFTIKNGETKDIELKLTANKKILETLGTLSFIYKVEGVKSGITEDSLAIKIARLEDALEINCYNINLDSSEAILYVKNRAGIKFPEIKAEFHSTFFDLSKSFSLDKYASTEFKIPLNKEETKKLVAGDYTLTSIIETLGIKKTLENKFKFTEKADVDTKETKKGIISRKLIIEKTNNGNLPTLVQVTMKKDILSRLFTTFNIEPKSSTRKGFMVSYEFQKEIRPSETYLVRATTNWTYPFLLVIAVLIIAVLVKNYVSRHVNVKKRIIFVKTKTGDFALKVNLSVKASKFVENVSVVDKLPSMVKLYEKFAVPPSKVDENNRRIEWNISSLNAGEERVFSYIIFSKVAPVGRFELPTCVAIYERNGKTYESESNRVFFMSEFRHSYHSVK